jgi:hypothetical protein
MLDPFQDVAPKLMLGVSGDDQTGSPEQPGDVQGQERRGGKAESAEPLENEPNPPASGPGLGPASLDVEGSGTGEPVQLDPAAPARREQQHGAGDDQPAQEDQAP